MIVEHFTVTSTFQAAYNIFAPNRADAELGERPGTCAHFVVDRDGTIYQLVPLSIRCRHTVGLNDRSIGIEQVGMTAAEILARPKQLAAITRLSAWLRCRSSIKLADIIGHAESLTSPYHHENVAALATQTHGDWTKPEASKLRRRIARYACADSGVRVGVLVRVAERGVVVGRCAGRTVRGFGLAALGARAPSVLVVAVAALRIVGHTSALPTAFARHRLRPMWARACSLSAGSCQQPPRRAPAADEQVNSPSIRSARRTA